MVFDPMKFYDDGQRRQKRYDSLVPVFVVALVLLVVFGAAFVAYQRSHVKPKPVAPAVVLPKPVHDTEFTCPSEPNDSDEGCNVWRNQTTETTAPPLSKPMSKRKRKEFVGYTGDPVIAPSAGHCPDGTLTSGPCATVPMTFHLVKGGEEPSSTFYSAVGGEWKCTGGAGNLHCKFCPYANSKAVPRVKQKTGYECPANGKCIGENAWRDQMSFVFTIPSQVVCSKLSGMDGWGNCDTRPLTAEEIDRYKVVTEILDKRKQPDCLPGGSVKGDIPPCTDMGHGDNTIPTEKQINGGGPCGEAICDWPDHPERVKPMGGSIFMELPPANPATKIEFYNPHARVTLQQLKQYAQEFPSSICILNITGECWVTLDPDPALDCKMPADIDVCPAQQLDPKAVDDKKGKP